MIFIHCFIVSKVPVFEQRRKDKKIKKIQKNKIQKERMEKKERCVYEHLLFKRDDRQTVSSAVNLVAFLSSDDTKECGQMDLLEEAYETAGTFSVSRKKNAHTHIYTKHRQDYD